MPRRLKWLNQGMVMGIQPTANVKLICSPSIDEIRTLSHMLGMIGWMNTVNVNVPVRLRPKKSPPERAVLEWAHTLKHVAPGSQGASQTSTLGKQPAARNEGDFGRSGAARSLPGKSVCFGLTDGRRGSAAAPDRKKADAQKETLNFS
ncbi:hypothetical protein [Ensifer sp. LC384]|uniref:hypothetical protein n=1 Tax=Ensifer sp. LC384 TaxID=1120653 RepID=UPI0011474254|nr:hypothetical protein [Ensifer sp. LC384]